MIDDVAIVMGVYSVFDKVAARYGPPFQALNDDVALRSFGIMLDGVHAMSKGDYELRRVGIWNPVSGILDKHEIVQVSNDFTDDGVVIRNDEVKK